MKVPRPQIDVKSWHEDFGFMQQALDLAAEGLGRVAPNPSVGCIIVKDGVVVGQARSADGGRPHAETQALAMAGDQSRGATVYCTLEPCGHFGQTPPCVDALIRAGIARVVAACRDPFQKDNGCVERLEAAGIEVVLGVGEEQALHQNEGFFKRIGLNRPLVTIKVATTLDGRIATRTGESKWITGEQARRRAHEFRAQHDAVLVGVGTVLADDPTLSVRLPGHDFQPLRIVIDRDLKTPLDSRLARSARESNVWFLCGEGADPEKRKRLAGAGARLLPLASDPDGRFAPKTLLGALAQAGLTRLLVEGGGVTVTNFLQAGMVDRLLWFRAPKLLGGDGLPAFQPMGIDSVEGALQFTLESREELGEDSLEIWQVKG